MFYWRLWAQTFSGLGCRKRASLIWGIHGRSVLSVKPWMIIARRSVEFMRWSLSLSIGSSQCQRRYTCFISGWIRMKMFDVKSAVGIQAKRIQSTKYIFQYRYGLDSGLNESKYTIRSLYIVLLAWKCTFSGIKIFTLTLNYWCSNITDPKLFDDMIRWYYARLRIEVRVFEW